jgi:hypothetical protein
LLVRDSRNGSILVAGVQLAFADVPLVLSMSEMRLAHVEGDPTFVDFVYRPRHLVVGDARVTKTLRFYWVAGEGDRSVHLVHPSTAASEIPPRS